MSKYNLTMYDQKTLSAAGLEAVARDVIDGKYGNGEERKAFLRKMGYDPDAVQKIVNQIVKKK